MTLKTAQDQPQTAQGAAIALETAQSIGQAQDAARGQAGGASAKGERTRKVKRTLGIVFAANLVVSVAKIAIGTVTGTSSVRADGIHSIFDCAGNLAGLVGISIASRPADAEHPYGHGKFETIASLVIGLMLLVAAVEVGSGAIKSLATGEFATQPSALSLAIMIATLVVNLGCSALERVMSKRLGSSVLGADSKHTLSDALVTISVIVGLVFVNLGFPIADPIATVIVTIAILCTAFDVLRDVNRVFSDEARIDAQVVAKAALEVDGVVQCHYVRTRGLENEVYMDMHVLVDPELSIERAHRIGEHVEQHMVERFPQVCEVVVHLEPATGEELICPLLEHKQSLIA